MSRLAICRQLRPIAHNRPRIDMPLSAPGFQELLGRFGRRVYLTVNQYAARVFSAMSGEFPSHVVTLTRQRSPLRFLGGILLKPKSAIVLVRK